MRSPTTSANFLRTLATPEPIKDWPLTSLKDNQDRREGDEPRPLCGLPKQVAIARQMFQEILRRIAELRPQPLPALA
jgi:hypothetical protein